MTMAALTNVEAVMAFMDKKIPATPNGTAGIIVLTIVHLLIDSHRADSIAFVALVILYERHIWNWSIKMVT